MYYFCFSGGGLNNMMDVYYFEHELLWVNYAIKSYTFSLIGFKFSFKIYLNLVINIKLFKTNMSDKPESMFKMPLYYMWLWIKTFMIDMKIHVSGRYWVIWRMHIIWNTTYCELILLLSCIRLVYFRFSFKVYLNLVSGFVNKKII